MRNRLLFTLALGVLLAVMAAGVVGAQSVSVGGGNVSVDVPGGPQVTVPDVLPCPTDDTLSIDDPDCILVPGTTTTPPSTTTPTGPTTTPQEPTDPTDTGTVPAPPTEPTDPTGGGGKGGEVPSTDNPFGPKGGKGGKHSFGGNGKGGKSGKADGGSNDDRQPMVEAPIRRPDGAPTASNPSVSITDFGAAPVGVPNFIIDQFTIPPFLLPIYQACGTQYGIPWEVLASINRIETAFGTNLNVSTAGALGWMQFIPSTWEMYGVDANGDGRKDPYNPVDAICAAARYLKAAGGQEDLYRAIFAYNHADWYVDEVLLYAKQYGNLPSGLVDSLTGLTEGAHFPVAAKARYADDISEREAAKRATPQKGSSGNAADVISESPTRRGIDIYAADKAPVVAVNDGVIKKIGKSKALGKYVVLQDAYGNRFTYAELGSVSPVVPVPRERKLSSKDFRLITPGEGDDKPTIAASTTNPREQARPDSESKGDSSKSAKAKKSKKSKKSKSKRSKAASAREPQNTENSRDRLFALPKRPANVDRAGLTGQLDSLLGKGMPGYETFKSYFSGVLHFDGKSMDTRLLREGSQVVAGTVLGRIGKADDGSATHVNFAIEPAGRGSETIDPKPILDGWKLLEATAIYRASGKNPFEERASVGQVLLASKAQLQQRVLSDPNIEIYSCGREDIQTGQIDRRVLATLEYLVQRGFTLTITSLKCGHSIQTSSGNISEHTTGNAVDIAQVNGLPILGNQGNGSITEAVINELLKLQGPMQPHQIISLMELGGPTFAMADHADHIHVGFAPLYGPGEDAQSLSGGLLAPGQWDKLLERIGQLDEPTVPTKPSKYSLPVKGKRASGSHIGE